MKFNRFGEVLIKNTLTHTHTHLFTQYTHTFHQCSKFIGLRFFLCRFFSLLRSFTLLYLTLSWYKISWYFDMCVWVPVTWNRVQSARCVYVFATKFSALKREYNNSHHKRGKRCQLQWGFTSLFIFFGNLYISIRSGEGESAWCILNLNKSSDTLHEFYGYRKNYRNNFTDYHKMWTHRHCSFRFSGNVCVPLATIKCKCQNINDKQKWQSDPFYHDGSTALSPPASISFYVVGCTIGFPLARRTTMRECDDHDDGKQLIETINCIWNIIRYVGISTV